ncbi:MAG TPA: phosphate ABC transporter substrate-binding protein PstS [bacterium]|nr:phosphate ABC transporter substrate-binding protein PstS [bacterium]
MRSASLMAVAVLVLVLGTTCLAAERELIGAGATFPYPLYSKMFDTYAQERGVKVNYQAIGSGGGIKQVAEKTVDFGGTDAFMSSEELEAAGAPIVHVPTCLGAVVLTYNVAGSPTIKLTPDEIADIFVGKIEKWNDPRLVSTNPGITLPDMSIVVVHRSDGSGTTFIFSDYLGKISAEWKEKVGVGKSLNWPAGLGAKGNPGVAGLIKQLPGSIGYVELIYALQNKMPVAVVQNKAGSFIEPTIASVSAAAAVPIPADTRVSITDTDAKGGYPISGFTWLIFYREQYYGDRSIKRATDLVDLVNWMVHEGQQFTQPLYYAPLPKEAVAKAEAILKSVTYKSRPLLAK